MQMAEAERKPPARITRGIAVIEYVTLEPGLTLDEVRYRYVVEALQREAWDVAAAAKTLGVNRNTIYIWLRRWGIKL